MNYYVTHGHRLKTRFELAFALHQAEALVSGAVLPSDLVMLLSRSSAVDI